MGSAVTGDLPFTKREGIRVTGRGAHGRKPASFPRPGVFPSDRVHVRPGSEQSAEQCHLRLRRRVGMHQPWARLE
jgi:hypothetical protein